MTFDDFLKLLEEQNEIIKLSQSYSLDLEISEKSRENLKQESKALLFENIPNSDIRVITDIFSSQNRIKIALNNRDIDELGQDILRYPIERNYVNKGILNSNTNFIDLTQLPALKSYEKEGGRFFTLGCVITKNPITKKQNSGIYRLQVFDKKHLGMHWHTFNRYHNNFLITKEEGMEFIEVAIVLGTHPANIIASALPFKKEFDEFNFYEILFNKKLETLKCKTIDIEVPIDSHVVIEGIVKIGNYRKEGAFFLHSGKYDNISMQPVFEASAVYIKENAVIPATVTGIPPAENSIMMSYLMKIFLPEIKQEIEEINDFHMPVEGVFNKILYLKINSKIEFSDIRKKILTNRLLKNFKMIALFNTDINFNDRQQVLWKISDFTNIITEGKQIFIDAR